MTKGDKINYRLRMPTLWKHPAYGTYSALWQEDGKRRRKSLNTKDERIAHIEFRKFCRDLQAGKVTPITSPGLTKTLSEFMAEFLGHVEARQTDTTLRLYSDALKKAVSCWGGSTPLRHITQRHLDRLIMDMLNSGLAVATVNKNYRHVKAALKKAIEWDYIQPFKFPKQIKQKEQVRYIPREHLRKIVDAIDDAEFLDFCLMSGCTGLRSGELLRLRWEDVNNPAGFIRVTSEQKNKTESRIPANSTASEIIERCRARSGAKVFRFKTLTHISQKFKRYIRSAGFEQYRFHDLRHTFASFLSMEGVDIKAVKDLMRHKSLASTEVYAKLSPEYLQSASDRFTFGPLPIRTKKS